ncbi:MAG TPA: M56 family metallopeptidase, partial [Flavobacterium sp.]|nr:M56 family metallopeptidase [Flavobacterium sp.]
KIKKHIVLLESRLVAVPSVTGFFKPIILLPAGLLSSLPQDEIEAILLHELAHIRRKDYFINLIQSFAEVLFFFNPGVLWVSSIIKEERENCCDDIAVRITKSKSKFINALISFQEYNMKQNQLALGFGSRRNQLLERAKRIIHENNKSLNSAEKTFLSICIIIIASFTAACSNSKTAASQESAAFFKESSQTRLSAEKQLAHDAAPAGNAAAEAKANAEMAEIETPRALKAAEGAKPEPGNEPREDAIAGKETNQANAESENSREEWKSAQAEISELLAEGETARGEAETGRIGAAKAREIIEKLREEGRFARAESALARLDAKKARQEKIREKIELLRASGEIEKIREEARKHRGEAYKAKAEARKSIREAKALLENLKKDTVCLQDMKKLVRAGKKPVIIKLGSMDDIAKDIAEDLAAQHLIPDAGQLSYKLTKKALVVNGKLLSDEIHEKLKKKLKGVSAIYYNYDIDKEDARIIIIDKTK